MLVEVRPVPQVGQRKPWEGPEDRDFTRPVVLEVLYDPATGGYATGLTEDEQIEYEKKLGVDLSARFDPDKPHSYWSSPASWIKLPNSTIFFDTENPREYVKIKNMKASKFVANSLQEWEKGLWPEATHVLFDTMEEAAMKASKIQVKQKAYSDLMGWSTEQKRELFEALTHRSGKGHNSDSLDVELSKIIEGEVDEPNLIQLARHISMDQRERTTRSMIVRGLEKFVLRRDGLSIMYLDTVIGFDFEDAVSYFLKPEHQDIKLRILEKIEENPAKAVKAEQAVKGALPKDPPKPEKEAEK